MSVNKQLPHVLVLPEDDANLRLANEFHLNVDWNRQRQLQVLPVAGGWVEVLDLFESVHVVEMDRYRDRYLVLLIDFDGRENRLQDAKARIPVHLTERVFVLGALGALSEPEALRSAVLTNRSVWGWRRIAVKERTRLGVMSCYDITRVSLSVSTKACVPSYSPPFEPEPGTEADAMR